MVRPLASPSLRVGRSRIGHGLRVPSHRVGRMAVGNDAVPPWLAPVSARVALASLLGTQRTLGFDVGPRGGWFRVAAFVEGSSQRMRRFARRA
jgi:hypothetical protein